MTRGLLGVALGVTRGGWGSPGVRLGATRAPSVPIVPAFRLGSKALHMMRWRMAMQVYEHFSAYHVVTHSSCRHA